MRLTLALLWLASIAAAQTNCVPHWAPNEFPLAGVNGLVNVMTTFDDGSGPALFAGGAFNAAGSVPASNIAKWNGSGWSAVGSGLNGTVSAMAVYDDGNGPALYVGGSFSAAGSVSASKVARWNGSSWSPVGTVLLVSPVAVTALTVYDDGAGAKLVAGGTAGIACWDGFAWTGLGSGVNALVRALASCDTGSGPRLYAAGDFTTAGTVQASKIACWDGTSWSNLGSGTTTGGLGPSTLASWNDGSGEQLYVGGDFTTIAGSPTPYLARWNGSAWAPPSHPLPIPETVKSLATLPTGSGSLLLALLGCHPAVLTPAGWSMLPCAPAIFPRTLATFDQGSGPVAFVAGQPGWIFRWTGSAWAQLESGLTGVVNVVAGLDDGTGEALYAGGRFFSSGGSPANCVAKRIGSSWVPLGGGVDTPNAPWTVGVQALASFDDGGGPGIYAGGSFTLAGGVAALNIARWNGSSWSALGPGLAGGAVHAMAVGDLGNGSRLFVGGDFVTAGALTVNGVAEWDGTSWSALGSGVVPYNSSVHTLVVYDDGSGPALYAGGGFSSAGGSPAAGIARWNGTTWGQVGGTNFSAFALTVFDDGTGPALYTASFFNGAPAIIRWNGTTWTSIGTGLQATGNTAWALAGFNDGSGSALYAAGHVSGGSPGFARWDGVSWSTPSSAFAGPISGSGNAIVLSLATADDGGGPALFAGGDFTMAGGQVSAGVAKWVAGGPPSVTAQPLTQIVNSGTTVSLSVSAVGALPLSYQWRKDGVVIAGAVGTTIAVSTTTPGEVATYDAVITNPCGTTTSQPAYVAVHPVILTMTQPQGAGSILIANTSGIPGSAYFSAFTFENANLVNPGNGFWLGLHIPYPELLAQFLTQTPPFVGVLDATGGSAFALPAGALAPSFSGSRVFALTAIYDPVALTVIGGSGIASLLLL